tara:strand:+ start:80084 stop:80569 length:486 start_codon:yes stop_codon:yes gene_type:complete
VSKFTISGTQFRTAKKDIKLDVVDEDGKVKKGMVVGWVTLRGEDDPIYQKRVAPHVVAYQEDVELHRNEISELKELAKEDESEKVDLSLPQEKLRGTIESFMREAVIASIEEWDEDFFEGTYSPQRASELFSDPSNNHIYNQLAAFIKDRDDFLPSASARL